ncbi:hypothetical protein EBR37_04350, partial [bacterium]|nr:hypothetical protein [bacterium]
EIADLRKRGAIVIVFGASESPDKIRLEIRRISDKIVEEQLAIERKSQLSKSEKRAMISALEDFRQRRFFKNKARTYRASTAIAQQSAKNFMEMARNISSLANIHIPDGSRFLVLEVLDKFLSNPQSLIDPELTSYFQSVSKCLEKKENSVLTDDAVQELFEMLKKAGDKFKPGSSATTTLKSTYQELIFELLAKLEKTDLLVKASFEGDDENSILLNALLRKLEAKKNQYESLKDRREGSPGQSGKTRLRFNQAEFINDERVEIGPDPNLVDLIGSYLPILEARGKLQYILPDFIFNERTCSDDDLRGIAELSKADIVIVPHIGHDGKLCCRIWDKGNVKISKVGSEIDRALPDTKGKKVATFYGRTDD